MVKKKKASIPEEWERKHGAQQGMDDYCMEFVLYKIDCVIISVEKGLSLQLSFVYISQNDSAL